MLLSMSRSTGFVIMKQEQNEIEAFAVAAARLATAICR